MYGGDAGGIIVRLRPGPGARDMSKLKLDADAIYRAVSAHDYKLMAYYLDLRTGEIVSKTLAPDEVKEAPRGPMVQPIPAFGHDINERKGDAPFGPPPVAAAKPGLFKDDGPKKAAFEGDFWKREGSKKAELFGDGGYRKESASKKLAELFGEKPATATPQPPPAAKPVPAADQPPPPPDCNEPLQRIPPASEAQWVVWMQTFAKDCGDPEIREKLETGLRGAKPLAAFEKTLRHYQRMNQQWDRYIYRQSLHYASAWLKDLPVQWEIVESTERPAPGRSL